MPGMQSIDRREDVVSTLTFTSMPVRLPAQATMTSGFTV
jgi:hypothetical protein